VKHLLFWQCSVQHSLQCKTYASPAYLQAQLCYTPPWAGCQPTGHTAPDGSSGFKQYAKV